MFDASTQEEPGSREETYRGAQQDLLVRGGGFLSIVGGVAVLALLPLYPPTRHLGQLGLVLMIPLSLASIGLGGLDLALKRRPTARAIYVSCYIGVAQLALVQWLAGGGKAPYIQLLLLPVLGAATGHPVRRSAPVALAALAAAASQLLYSTINLSATLLEFSLLVLLATMTAAIMSSTRSHRARLMAAGEQATTLANLDPLTRLPNRRAFDEAFLAAFEGCKRGTTFSLILCDVNSFKQVNDSFGHEAGDELLRTIADAISEAVRKPDAAFRWAGDEFAVILRDSDEAGANLAASRIRHEVARRCRRPDGAPVTIGTGLSQLDPHLRAKEVFMAADRALFCHKTKRAQLQAVSRAD